MSLLSLSVHLQKMLCFSPSKRITASEALLHPYFSEYGFEPLSFSPSSSSSSRSMRSSDASSSFNSSFLSSSSHNESGGSMGDPNQWTTRSVTVMIPMLESIAVHLNKFNIEIPVPTLVQSLSDLTWNPIPRSQEFIISYLLKIFFCSNGATTYTGLKMLQLLHFYISLLHID